MLLPCEATLLRPNSPTIHLPRLPWHPAVTRCFCGAFLVRRSRLCFLKMNQTAVLFPSPPLQPHAKKIPPSSFFFYPLFMSPVALDQDPRKANPTPRGGGRVTAGPVFARSFFLAESDPAVLLSCQIF